MERLRKVGHKDMPARIRRQNNALRTQLQGGGRRKPAANYEWLRFRRLPSR
eukprot:SAG22_NODE_17681_length_300_cov_1.029851_1_plen_50_part_10